MAAKAKSEPGVPELQQVLCEELDRQQSLLCVEPDDMKVNIEGDRVVTETGCGKVIFVPCERPACANNARLDVVLPKASAPHPVRNAVQVLMDTGAAQCWKNGTVRGVSLFRLERDEEGEGKITAIIPLGSFSVEFRPAPSTWTPTYVPSDMELLSSYGPEQLQASH